jgi:arylsulfatase A-like enzyme
VVYIFSDNGASAEGMQGSIEELNTQNAIPTTPHDHIAVLGQLGGLDVLGGPRTHNMYQSAWAWAGDTPFRYTKLVASDFGGSRTPMVISWPARISPDPTPRPQFHRVTDVVPTLYEILGIRPPEVIDGYAQDPIDGTSFAYTFTSSDAAGQKSTQYFEILTPFHWRGRRLSLSPGHASPSGLPAFRFEGTPDVAARAEHSTDDSRTHHLHDQSQIEDIDPAAVQFDDLARLEIDLAVHEAVVGHGNRVARRADQPQAGEDSRESRGFSPAKRHSRRVAVAAEVISPRGIEALYQRSEVVDSRDVGVVMAEAVRIDYGNDGRLASAPYRKRSGDQEERRERSRC